MTKLNKIFSVFAVALLTACASSTEVAENRRFTEPRFDTSAPIELNVNKIDVISEFTPSFTRPNVEHLFPVSIEKAARIWAGDRLEAVDFSSNRVAEFIIKDASVTEEEIKASQLFYKDSLKYRATLSVVLKISSDNGQSSAQTSIEAWRELTMPIDTSIEDKEKYWNDMVQKLFEEFNVRMEQNINQYLNMYVKNNNMVFEY
ncbi:MAG: hypothetical protein IJW75_06170 [Alphaproteobacteria bacterium]|nr:hypothetical protein [Alphaproteobacteria bacterium]